MSVFLERNIEWIFHTTPLHYIPSVMHESMLRSKPSLKSVGFTDSHFRSMSKKQDVERGFGNYVHLTTNPYPPILNAKLSGGFPHCSIKIPTTSVDDEELDFCRYNVAMSRYLNRPGGTPLKESDSNGRFYDGKQIPVARLKADKRAMLSAHFPNKTIEILKSGQLHLDESAKVVAYSQADAELIERIKEKKNCPWEVLIDDLKYQPDPEHWCEVNSYVETVLENPDWRGNELEFDRL